MSTDDEEVAGWADPGERHEGGTFTLDAEDHGTFVGDAAGTLVAEFRTLGPAEDIFCTPEPREPPDVCGAALRTRCEVAETSGR